MKTKALTFFQGNDDTIKPKYSSVHNIWENHIQKDVVLNEPNCKKAWCAQFNCSVD